MNKDLKKAILILFAFAGFLLMFQMPDSAWMDKHQNLYWPSIITGGVMWIIGLRWLIIAIGKGEW
jgi:hypothetical protein